jgi:MFS family permease
VSAEAAGEGAALDRSYRALFAIPSIPRIIAAMTLARLAASMTSVAVILFSLDHYGSAALTGLVTFASLFPSVIASPFAGALLDRHGRARLVILDYLLAGAALALVALLAALGALPPPVLITIVAFAALTNPLSNSGVRTLLPVLVPEHLWPRVNATDVNSFVLAQLVGPPLAGAVTQVAGPGAALVTIAVLFVVAAVMTVGIPDPPLGATSSGRLVVDARNGLMYVLRNPTLRGIAAASFSLRLGSGVLAIAMPVIVLATPGGGPAVVGLAYGVSAVTGFISTLLAARFDLQGRERLVLALCWGGSAAGLVLLLGASNVLWVFVAMAVTGAIGGPADVTMFTLRQRRSDPAWFGRAFAVSSSFNFAGYPVGSAIAGAVIDQALSGALVFGVIVALLSGVIAWFLIPEHDDAATIARRTSVRN